MKLETGTWRARGAAVGADSEKGALNALDEAFKEERQ
jgi:hypothetical protein